MIDFQALLDAREIRVCKQEEWIKATGKPLVVLRINTPGLPKDTRTAKTIFEVIKGQIQKDLGSFIKKDEVSITAEGFVWMLSVSLELETSKRYCIQLEEEHPLGRFVDLDVYTLTGASLSRRDLDIEPRKCYLCKNEAHVCVREKKHSYESLQNYIQQSLIKYMRKYL